MWVFPPGERAFLGSLTSIPSQAAAVLHCTITARSRERLARASNMFKASKAVGFSEGSLSLYSNGFLYNVTFCKLINIHFVTVTVTIFGNYVCVISLIKLRSTAFHC